MTDGQFIVVAVAVVAAAVWLLAKLNRRIDKQILAVDKLTRAAGYDRKPVDRREAVDGMTVDQLRREMRATPLDYTRLRDGRPLTAGEMERMAQVWRGWAATADRSDGGGRR